MFIWVVGVLWTNITSLTFSGGRILPSFFFFPHSAASALQVLDF